jgi:hypothetical protein
MLIMATEGLKPGPLLMKKHSPMIVLAQHGDGYALIEMMNYKNQGRFQNV